MQINLNRQQLLQSQTFINTAIKTPFDLNVLNPYLSAFIKNHNLHQFLLTEESKSGSISLHSKKINKSAPIVTSNGSKASNKRAPWKPHEDAQVIELVSKLGQKWTEIGKLVGNRTGKQVRERYLYTLNPAINKDRWTKEEDYQLRTLYQEFGNKWHQIAKHLPGRTENQIKNRLNPKFRETMSLSSDETKSNCVTDTPPVASTCDDDLSALTLDLPCGLSFVQSCESILEMSLKINI